MADKVDKSKKKFLKRATGYFKEMKSDFKKIVWPTPKSVGKNTSLVIVALIISGTMIGLIDMGFLALANFLVNL